MTTVSQRLLANLARQETPLDPHLERVCHWIWLLILHRQSTDVLHEELSAIERVVETSPPQTQLELAWKAQVIEDVLSSNAKA